MMLSPASRCNTRCATTDEEVVTDSALKRETNMVDYSRTTTNAHVPAQTPPSMIYSARSRIVSLCPPPPPKMTKRPQLDLKCFRGVGVPSLPFLPSLDPIEAGTHGGETEIRNTESRDEGLEDCFVQYFSPVAFARKHEDYASLLDWNSEKPLLDSQGSHAAVSSPYSTRDGSHEPEEETKKDEMPNNEPPHSSSRIVGQNHDEHIQDFSSVHAHPTAGADIKLQCLFSKPSFNYDDPTQPRPVTTTVVEDNHRAMMMPADRQNIHFAKAA